MMATKSAAELASCGLRAVNAFGVCTWFGKHHSTTDHMTRLWMSKLSVDAGSSTSPVSVLPYFRITDWVGAEPIMRQFVELTAQDPTCVHYGWTSDGSGRVVWNSHVSKSDEALVDYLDRVEPLVSAMVEGECAGL